MSYYTVLHYASRLAASQTETEGPSVTIGDSKSTVRRYCLDIPRFEESLNKYKQHNEHLKNKVSNSNNG